MTAAEPPEQPRLLLWARLRASVKALEIDVRALGLGLGDRRVPWYAKVLAFAVVAYAVSPIDLIPDFIPILGFLDDLILVPVGLWLVLRMIPPPVMAELRDRAASSGTGASKLGWVGAVFVVAVWVAIVLAILNLFWPVELAGLSPSSS